MKQYHNKKETFKVGANIKRLRKTNGYSLDDISDMTGFGKTLLSSIENGAETGTSHLIEIAKAIGVHPKEIFNVPFKLQSRYELRPQRGQRKMLAFRIARMFDETDFFNSGKYVRDVVGYFKEQYKTKVSSTSVAGALRRFALAGKIKTTKKGRQNIYSIK